MVILVRLTVVATILIWVLMLSLYKIINHYRTLLERCAGCIFRGHLTRRVNYCCGRGAILDVVVDIRRGSSTYGHWEGYEPTADNGYQLYVPVGFAHGFLTIQPDSEIIYKCTEYYAPETEGGVRWDSCGIEWPLSVEPTLSAKDASAPLFSEFESPFVLGKNS